MASDAKVVRLKVSCLCGACESTCEFDQADTPLTTHLCTCDNCRCNTGSLYYGSIDWPTGVPGCSSLVRYTRSKSIYYFCGTCGSMLFWTQPDGRGPKASAGAVENASDIFLPLGFEWINSTADGGLANILTKINGKALNRYQFDEYRSEELPIEWHAPIDKQVVNKLDNDTLPVECICGQVHFRLTRPKSNYTVEDLFGDKAVAPPWLVPRGGRFVAGLCACRTCRKSVGTDITCWVWTPKANILNDDGSRFIPEQCQELSVYKSSKGVRRYFCSQCGAKVGCDLEIRPALIDIGVGLLRSQKGALAEDWLEWTHGLSFTEDAINPTFVDAMSEAYDDWRRHKGTFHLKSVRPHGFVNADSKQTL